jgi:O-succinylbenzoate synthase
VRIVRVELYHLRLPLVEPFIISGGTMTERTSLVVVLHDEEGRQGYGESPPFELPFYSDETLVGARDLLERVLIPRILGCTMAGPEDLDAALRVGVRGNPFARAALDTAGWDLEAARRGTGLAALLGERLSSTPAADIPCGVALGIPQDRSVDTLRRWIAAAVSHGYRRVKIKVAPGWDARPVTAARRELAGTGLPLTVDGNGAFEWPEHEAALRTMDEADLLYIEQPLHPDELVGHARLGERLRTPVCLDETLRDARAARQVLELGGPLVWNVKVHRVGGLSEVVRIVVLARQAGVRLWAGTMPESGLGSQAALAAAAMPEFVYPSDLEPSSRWFGPGQDVIELTMTPQGRMAVPRQPIHQLVRPAQLARASTRLLDLRAGAR